MCVRAARAHARGRECVCVRRARTLGDACVRAHEEKLASWLVAPLAVTVTIRLVASEPGAPVNQVDTP